MKKLRKVLIILSGLILVILGFFAVGFFALGFRPLWNHHFPLLTFSNFLFFFCGPLFIVSGIGLFFFKKWAWKSAVFYYKILFLLDIYYNIVMYVFTTMLAGWSKPHLFSVKNIINYFRGVPSILPFVQLLLIFISIFFIVVLNSSKEEFGIEVTQITNRGFSGKLISSIRNNTTLGIIVILVLAVGTVFVKYSNRRIMARLVCKGKCNVGPVPGPLVNIDNPCYKKCVEDGYSQVYHFEDWMKKMNTRY